jgi:hypothetical protein
MNRGETNGDLSGVSALYLGSLYVYKFRCKSILLREDRVSMSSDAVS